MTVASSQLAVIVLILDGGGSIEVPAKPKLVITGPEEVEVGTPFELHATARDSTLGKLDFTLGAEWSVVPQGMASIEHGRGKALIPGPAVITAIDRQLDIAASWSMSFRPKAAVARPPVSEPTPAASRLVRIEASEDDTLRRGSRMHLIRMTERLVPRAATS